MKKIMPAIFLVLFFTLFSCSNNPVAPWGGPVNTANPSSTVKLIFMHHSTGCSWISTGDGNLGAALNAANIFTNETNYSWNFSPAGGTCSEPIGDHTDTTDWPCWFNNTTMPGVYTADERNYNCYSANSMADPGAGVENEIIMFKSCYPLSEVGDDITDEQAIYNSLLAYFSVHTDKMFVLIIPPPMQVISNPLKTRELTQWLADRSNGWLKNYTFGNVFAFDYYNVLTHPDNHHYVSGGYEYHVVANSQNTLYYPTGDDHPNSVGQQKATAEFVPLLKAWWHQWKNY